MYPLSALVKVTLPNYLAGLPLPDTLAGWLRLSPRDWLSLVPPTAVVAGIGYYSYQVYRQARENGQVNTCVRKDVDKVVDFVDIEDIMDKAVFCRCWKTKNWPYCDGSHGAHNKESGDNVGPLIVKHKEKK